MINKIITAVIGLVAVSALVLSIGNAVGGNTQLGTAARTRLPNGLEINSTGTSTLKLVPRTSGQVGCIEIVGTAGTTTAVTIAGSGAAFTFNNGAACN